MAIAVMVLGMTGTAMAEESGSCGEELTWTYDENTLTLTILGTGDMDDFSSGNQPWNAFIGNIASVNLPEGLTKIGKYAFDKSGLTAVTIPSAVTTIEMSAFSNCQALESVSFEGESALEYIGALAFHNCKALPHLDIPGSVTNIDLWAFNSCTGLKDVTVHWTDLSGLQMNSPFKGITTEDIYLFVPNGTKSVYASNTTWQKFKIIDPADFAGSCGVSGDEVTFAYDENTHTLTFSGTGQIKDYDYNLRPWNPYCEWIEHVVIGEGITGIGVEACKKLSSMTSVSLPSTLTFIGSHAFESGTSLTSITFPSQLETIGFEAFWGCTGLTSIDISASVTTIGNYAFAKCSNLADVYVHWTTPPGGVSTTAFADIASPATLHVPFGKKSAYEGTEPWSNFNIVEIPPSGQCGDELFWDYDPETHVFTITGSGAMYDYASSGLRPWYDYRADITSLILPEGLTYIGIRAFMGCASLTNLDWPSTLTGLGMNAFSYCNGLTSLTIPEWLTDFSIGAFRECTGLKSVTFLNETAPIGESMFAGCTSLTSVTIPNTVDTIWGETFSLCTSLTSIDLPDSLKYLGGATFLGCSNMTSITLPKGLTYLGHSNFQRSGLTSLVIPEGVPEIMETTLQYCDQLEWVDIPSTVTNLGWGAFAHCPNMNDLYVHWEDPAGVEVSSMAFFAFESTRDITVHVPYGTKSAYEATSPWNASYFHIVEESPEAIEEILANPATDGRKVLIDGQVYLKYNGKLYDVQGKEVR